MRKAGKMKKTSSFPEVCLCLPLTVNWLPRRYNRRVVVSDYEAAFLAAEAYPRYAGYGMFDELLAAARRAINSMVLGVELLDDVLVAFVQDVPAYALEGVEIRIAVIYRHPVPVYVRLEVRRGD